MRARTNAIFTVRTSAHGLAVAMVALTLHAVAHGATIDYTSAWMRPALAGQESARAYIDIKSDTALTLTQATTPAARAIEIVVVGTGNDVAEEKVVATFPVAAGTPTRLAFRGNHLRLVGVNRNLLNGEIFPVTLTFADTAGRVSTLTADITVRGFMVPAAESGRPRP